MGYVRTSAEISAYENYYKLCTARFVGLSATFTTTADFARHVLPPCFEVPANPTGYVVIGSVTEEHGGEFTRDEELIGVVGLDTSVEGRAGSYSLTVIVTNDMSMATGRESWGMPKKLGEVGVYGDGEKMYGAVSRRCRDLIRLEMTLGKHDEGPSKTPGRFFEIKGGIKADGAGLQHDPVLVTFQTIEHCRFHQPGDVKTASLEFYPSHSDPVATIPIVSLDSVAYRGTLTTYQVESQSSIGSSVDYRPYLYGRFFDDWVEAIQLRKKHSTVSGRARSDRRAS